MARGEASWRPARLEGPGNCDVAGDAHHDEIRFGKAASRREVPGGHQNTDALFRGGRELLNCDTRSQAEQESNGQPTVTGYK